MQLNKLKQQFQSKLEVFFLFHLLIFYKFTCYFSEELARQLQEEENSSVQEPQRPVPSTSRPQVSPGRSQTQRSPESNNKKVNTIIVFKSD